MIAVMVQVLLFWIFVCLTTIQVSSQILPHFPLLEFSSLPLNNNKLLALTFDDGPDKVGATRAILNVLNTHHVPGTFFINSNNALNINNSPESQQLLRQIVASGHELASHSETHRDLAVIPEAQIEGELINVQKAVDNALANTNLISPRLTHFRAPYGSPFQNPSLYPDEKLKVISSTVGKYSIHIGWSIDSYDYLCETVECVVNNTLSEVASGKWGVILMHSLYLNTANALPSVITRLTNMGYTFTTIESIVIAKYGKSSSECVQEFNQVNPPSILTPTGPTINSSLYQPPIEPIYDYAEVLHKSYLFYWAQRSGKLPYQRLAWRGDSCLDCIGEYGEDLSGAWYEAANTMKWGTPLAFTATQLAWNIYEFRSSLNAVDEYTESLEWIKQGADYLLNVYTTNSTHERLVALYGVSAAPIPNTNTKYIDVDFHYFGPPEEYQYKAPKHAKRQAFYCIGSVIYHINKGCSDIAGDYAAALASAAVVFKESNPEYSARCLKMAVSIYGFALRYLGTYQDATKFPDIGFVNYRQWYPSIGGYLDELSYASIWLYIATNDPIYLTKAKSYYTQLDHGVPEYSWCQKGIATAILLHKLTGDQTVKKHINVFFEKWLPNGWIPRTPRGLAYYLRWGSLRYTANTAFLALVHANRLKLDNNNEDEQFIEQLETFSIQQTNYILGDCGRSWVVGFGENSPALPYHKSSYNSFIDYPTRAKTNDEDFADFLYSSTANRFILYGALVGGPDEYDRYYDNRHNYEYTEVAQDYNAAFTGVLAGLINYYGNDQFEPFSDCSLDLGWNHPNASVATRKPIYAANDCYHTCNVRDCANNYNFPIVLNSTNPSSSGFSLTNGIMTTICMVILGVVLVHFCQF